MVLLADRFLAGRDTWFDIATAQPVKIVIHPAGPPRAQIAWAEQCAMLIRLRHSLLNPLIDFGAADRSSLFEAYAPAPPVAVPAASLAGLSAHLQRFLDAHGVSPAGAAARVIRRRTEPGRRATLRRPLGIVLQPRRAYDAIDDLLAASGRGGTTPVEVSGLAGSGLQTLAATIARAARLQGYVPVCPGALGLWPALFDALARRHVCLIADWGAPPSQRGAAAALLARLAVSSARAHVSVSLRRGYRRSDDAIDLDAMGSTSMSSMTYIDPELGPSTAELFAAARHADGMPGRFLARLAGRPWAAPAATRFTVHETSPAYQGDTSGLPARPRAGRSRIDSVLCRAGARAAALTRKGRHAAALRLLVRAARVLEGRGDVHEASRCWLQLAWLSRARGRVEAAHEHASRAAAADPGALNQIASALVIAVCWTDEGRLHEAEASLRSLVVAAGEASDPGLRDRCVLALARVMFWQGRYAEIQTVLAAAADSARPEIACESRLLIARSRMASADLPGALCSVRDAATRAAALDEPRLRAACSLATAEALSVAGDVDGVRLHVAEGLRIALAAHLPLHGLRLRAVLLQAVAASLNADADARRMRASLQRALHRPVPLLIARRVEAACRVERRGSSCADRDAGGSAGQLMMFLNVAHRAKDDLAAVQDVLAALCQHLGAAAVVVINAVDRRTTAAAGKPWRDRPAAAEQALESGRPVPLDPARRPAECAEPVRCGGELIGAIGCRWLLGATLAGDVVRITAGAAALALATHLRAVLDRPSADGPPPAWGDLLGDSAIACELREAIRRASRAPFPVLIEGESGCGKELVARAIHRLSARHTRRFCAINCAALTDELVEAELFGHTRGAFTGAATERAGLFEEADGGTLFLDEIGELSARAQAKLLRVLQEGEVRRVGENFPRRVDVRIVAATNRRLEHEASHGRFRTDLRFRLDVLRIAVPPLRERVADIPMLAQHFWRQASARLGSAAVLGPDALAALSRYDWPGNVRELQNAIAWIAVHAPRRGRVSAAMLPAQVATSPLATGSFDAAREEFERRFVRAALAQAGGQRQVAARALGMSRQGLSKMLRRLGLDGEETA